jgi:predicted Co/Zn/Cd cation transporter (cation efflux family)
MSTEALLGGKTPSRDHNETLQFVFEQSRMMAWVLLIVAFALVWPADVLLLHGNTITAGYTYMCSLASAACCGRLFVVSRRTRSM